MKKLIAASALSLTLLPAGLAAAQDANASARAPAPDVTFEFRDHDVDGANQVALGERFVVRRRGERQSLVRARSHFLGELAGSIEHL